MAQSISAKAALHTPTGSGGIAVIVLSGKDSAAILQVIFKSDSELPDIGRLALGKIISGDYIIDEAIIACVNNCPDCFEINIHGGPQSVRSVLNLLSQAGAEICSYDCRCSADSFRTSTPDIKNPALGREMLDAVSRGASVMAMKFMSAQWTGGLSRLVSDSIEALEAVKKSAGNEDLSGISSRLSSAADRMNTVQNLLVMPTVVFAGPPNAGKTSLVNAISARQVGIVSAHAGTTRDWLESCVDIKGFALKLIDTAGLFDSEHVLDAESVSIAWQKIRMADLAVAVYDAFEPQRRHDSHFAELLRLPNAVPVANKSDIAQTDSNAIAVSAETGAGLDELTDTILKELGLLDIDITEPAAFTLRQQELLQSAASSLSFGDILSALADLKALLEAA